MNKITKAFIIMTAFVFICPAIGQADIVHIKNGDELIGTIQNPAFTIQTNYGNIEIKKEYLKSITLNNGAAGHCIAETLNNDRFSGTLLNQSIRFLQEDGKQEILSKEQIKRIKRENRAPSYPVMTTIFTMQNNDRFSGKLLDTAFEIRANYITKSIQSHEINRVELSADYQANIKILLENGDLITGTLKTDRFSLAPDSIAELTVAKSSIKSIQFNAPKMVLKEFSGAARAERDSDGDGIPDFADICMDTPKGVRVNQDGCSTESEIAGLNNHQKINGVARRETTPGAIENVLFDFNRSEIKPQYYSVLDDVAVMLAQNPHARVEIQGHTDNIGSAEYNRNLSEKRARTVKKYFVQKGVEKDRLLPVGYGFTNSKASNEDETGRALNRRVEFALQ